MIDKNTIPGHWEIKKLREVGKVVTGTTPPKKEKDNYGKDIPFVKPPQLFNKPIFDAPEKLSNKGAQYARLLPINSVLVTCIGNLGRTAINRSIVAFNQQINAIIPSEGLNGLFLFYQAQSHKFKDQLENLESATTVPIVNKSKFESINVVIPPPSEQQQIVSKIEELFSELDKGKQQLETVRQQLTTYRQAVLKWAFEGRFTNKNIKDGQLPERWRWVKLKEVCYKIQDGSHFSPQTQYTEPGENRFKYITAKNIRNNYMDLSNVKFVDKEFHNSIFNRCNPEFGDVLLTKDGVNTGEVTLNILKEEFSLLSSVCIFKTNKRLLKADFLKYFIQSPYGSKVIEGSMTGTAIKRIILRKIKEAEILVPSLVEQDYIVNEIETRLSVCDKMEETIESCLQQTETLQQSILKQAFEGKLI
jgi:type I restriction enzyme S subunit